MVDSGNTEEGHSSNEETVNRDEGTEGRGPEAGVDLGRQADFLSPTEVSTRVARGRLRVLQKCPGPLCEQSR